MRSFIIILGLVLSVVGWGVNEAQAGGPLATYDDWNLTQPGDQPVTDRLPPSAAGPDVRAWDAQRVQVNWPCDPVQLQMHLPAGYEPRLANGQPIPSGGRAFVQIIGRMGASSEFATVDPFSGVNTFPGTRFGPGSAAFVSTFARNPATGMVEQVVLTQWSNTGSSAEAEALGIFVQQATVETTVEDDAQGMRKIVVSLSDSQGRIFRLEAGPAPFEDSASRTVPTGKARFLRPDGGAPPLFDNAAQSDFAFFSTSDFRLKVTFSTPNHQLRLSTGLLPLDKTLPPVFVFVDGVQVFLQKAD